MHREHLPKSSITLSHKETPSTFRTLKPQGMFSDHNRIAVEINKKTKNSQMSEMEQTLVSISWV